MPVSLRITATLLALLLSACAAPNLDTPEARVTVTRDDEFLPYLAVGGKTVQFGTFPELRRVTVIARRDRKSGVLSTHARIMISYVQSLRRHYEVARNDRGERLPMTEISALGAGCRRPDCTHTEEYLIDIPEADVRAAQFKGYAFKVFERAGSDILFQIPPPLVQAIIEAADKLADPAAKTVTAKKNG